MRKPGRRPFMVGPIKHSSLVARGPHSTVTNGLCRSAPEQTDTGTMQDRWGSRFSSRTPSMWSGLPTTGGYEREFRGSEGGHG